MCIGFRAFLDFERPDPELVESYRGIPSANIGDCVRKMTCMFDGIRSFNKKPLVGTAFTVKVPSGDNLVAQMALDYAKPGDIIVVDGAGYTDRALVGGMMLAYAQERILGGFVVSGAVISRSSASISGRTLEKTSITFLVNAFLSISNLPFAKFCYQCTLSLF